MSTELLNPRQDQPLCQEGRFQLTAWKQLENGVSGWASAALRQRARWCRQPCGTEGIWVWWNCFASQVTRGRGGCKPRSAQAHAVCESQRGSPQPTNSSSSRTPRESAWGTRQGCLAHSFPVLLSWPEHSTGEEQGAWGERSHGLPRRGLHPERCPKSWQSGHDLSWVSPNTLLHRQRTVLWAPRTVEHLLRPCSAAPRGRCRLLDLFTEGETEGKPRRAWPRPACDRGLLWLAPRGGWPPASYCSRPVTCDKMSPNHPGPLDDLICGLITGLWGRLRGLGMKHQHRLL